MNPACASGARLSVIIRASGAAVVVSGMPRIRRSFLIAIAGSGACAGAAAHGFGQSVNLPIPLWLWLAGAGLTVVLSFAAVIDFLPRALQTTRYPVFCLLRSTPRVNVIAATLIGALRALCVGLLALSLIAAFAGSPVARENLAPTLVWILFWVGVAFTSALCGDVWAMVNPLRTVFVMFERVWRALTGRPFTPVLSYPRALAAWPAVVVLFAFAWIEHVWTEPVAPATLGVALLGYCAVTLGGMFLYGREIWLLNADAFALFFRLFARFAPFEVRVEPGPAHGACGQAICRANDEACINGTVCLTTRPRPAWTLNLRPPAAGLLRRQNLDGSHVVFILLALASVTFDGFLATAWWRDTLALASAAGRDTVLNTLAAATPFAPATLARAIGLVTFPLLFGVLFLLTCATMARLDRKHESTGTTIRGALAAAADFVPALMPIAIAYHLAHYLSAFVMLPTLLWPRLLDPLGTVPNPLALDPAAAGFDVNLLWTLIVAAIIAGHVLSVYLAHVLALERTGDRRLAVRTELPLLALMVCYTMISLWILAQPMFA